MKRLICLLLGILLMMGCGHGTVSPSAQTGFSTEPPIDPTMLPTCSPSPQATAPAATASPRPLPTAYPHRAIAEVYFPEELFSTDADPVDLEILSLLAAKELTKDAFYLRFSDIILHMDLLAEEIARLAANGRTLTAARKDTVIHGLLTLMDEDTQKAIQNAYSLCPGEGEELPWSAFHTSVNTIIQSIEGTENRTAPFFRLDPAAAREYRSALDRYMGESVAPDILLSDLEDLTQTEAYALSAALQSDPEVARKKEPISFGSFSRNMAFLRNVSIKICPLFNSLYLPDPIWSEEETEMDLLQLAFRYYPGIACIRAYAEQAATDPSDQWANAPDGYIKGIAVHASYAVLPYLKEYGMDYLQYRWYEEMLHVTLTGISSLLIHYYGYTKQDLADYLTAWGAEEFTDYLFEQAMSEPFDPLIEAYGYFQYLEICEAALDAGCESEERFLQEYLTVGPAPFASLKEYMVRLYQKQG